LKSLPLVAGTLITALMFGHAYAKSEQKTLTTAQMKQIIIEESIASYSGNCPCPYNSARNGSRCGKRSAYNRRGGYAPLCYPEDVTDEMVKEYRVSRSQ
jgi:hypothetical protein